jgi:hypothetical protein
MKSIPPKLHGRFLAHNPTGELVRVITKVITNKKNKSYESKSRANTK